MRNRKSIIVLLLIAVMLIVTACGSGGGNSSDHGSGTSRPIADKPEIPKVLAKGRADKTMANRLRSALHGGADKNAMTARCR